MEQKTFAARVYAGSTHVCMHACRGYAACVYAGMPAIISHYMPKRRAITQELQWIFASRETAVKLNNVSQG